MKLQSRVAYLVIVSMLMAGCSAMRHGEANPSAVAAAKIAVQFATTKYIARVPPAEQAAKAARVRAVVTAVESLATGESVSLAVLEQAIRRQLPADLKPEDLVAINGLIGLVMAELHARVGDGLLNPDQRLQVSEVASWIDEATRYYSD